MSTRVLRLTTPHLDGADVRALQIALNARLTAGGLKPLRLDGDYGPDTRAAYEHVAWILGLDEAAIHKGATVAAQRIIGDPGLRSVRQLAAARSRQHSFAGRGRIAQKTVAWCRSKVGITEQPGSRRDPEIAAWEREFGLGPVYWCGVFVGYALRKVAGIPVPAGVAYAPTILGWAQARTNGFDGLYPFSEAKPGDLILFDFGETREPAEHVGIYAGAGRTIEGNTSGGPAGPQVNGGGVFVRTRVPDVVVGAARPRYPR